MNDDLRNIGDALERAIAHDIATTDATAMKRNNVVAIRHVSVEHTDSPKEAPVSSATPISTSTDRKRRLSRRRVAVIAALATLGVGGAAAAATIHLSSDEVSHGLPGGSVIFEDTGPSCTTTRDSDVFHCTLASAPTHEVLTDYTGALETFIDTTSHVAGGCIANTADGLDWTCYAGKLAVDKGIVGPELLGQLQNGPSHG